ncbi:MAG: hypothetical protein HN725_17570 [Alphaproteobacteria bacterium]|nr:hypothetical protein [Alphaproteobacteria bacterium]MBT4085755.1 hypothetical protein [Alphaproteobacteria bacterium]MBT4543334.1 hypothetical protein [Alphaproteobacteria bacterium]MBT7747100.1 hypothetical protein [Alphaproteobacteria bacterium]
MRGNSYRGNAALPQAANDPGQPPAPRRRGIPAPINDNRPPLWRRRWVQLTTLVVLLIAGSAGWKYIPVFVS